MSTFTIPEWCERHKLSRAMLYQLLKDGLGPRTFHVGRRRLISEDADREWVARMEARSATQPAREAA